MSFLELESNSAYPTEQKAYALRVKEILSRTYTAPPKAAVVTYGCQQNVSDSERLKGMLCLMGYELCEEIEEADFVIFNTCAVRGHAEDRVYGNVGSVKKYKKAKKEMLVAVCGCMVQQPAVAERFLKSYPYVDILFGTQVSHRLPEFIYRKLNEGRRVLELALDNEKIVEDVPVSRDGKVRAYIPIMYGCNNFCTYCIVPYVRGRERSRQPEEVIKEAKQLISSGYKEIMLLGQNVNSYGKDLEGDINFAKLLRMINELEGDFRIRFMTSHPKDCTIELLDAMRDCTKVERHLHLPVQSGSDRILKQMNRHYDSKTYLSLIDAARERMPDITFTSDIIVGFPGETYEDFKETVDIIKRVKYASLFTFIYSPREGTPAAVMPDPVTRKEKGIWFTELLRVQEQIAEENGKELVGKTVRVLFDEEGNDEGILIGKSESMAAIEVKAEKELLNTFAKVKITEYTNVLKGTLI